MNKFFMFILLVVVVAAGAWYLMRNSTATTNTTNTINKKTEVTLTTSGFEPKDLTVKVLTKVIWTNKSGVMATVDSANHPSHLLYPLLNLGQFNNGETLSLIFDKVGTFKYHNHFNATATGEIVVE